MAQHSTQVEQFVGQLNPPLDEIITNLRALLKELAPDAKESVKWRNLYYDLNGGLCMLVPAKDYARIEFFKGASLPDPSHILEGTGKAGGRHVKIKNQDDITGNGIKSLIEAAIELNAT